MGDSVLFHVSVRSVRFTSFLLKLRSVVRLAMLWRLISIVRRGLLLVVFLVLLLVLFFRGVPRPPLWRQQPSSCCNHGAKRSFCLSGPFSGFCIAHIQLQPFLETEASQQQLVRPPNAVVLSSLVSWSWSLARFVPCLAILYQVVLGFWKRSNFSDLDNCIFLALSPFCVEQIEPSFALKRRSAASQRERGISTYLWVVDAIRIRTSSPLVQPNA